MTVPPRQATPALLQVDAILARLPGAIALAEVCRYLRAEFPPYAWIGIYRTDGPLLRLVAWSGDRPTEHEVIPVGRGLCGRAVRENATVHVEDVGADPDYLACFPETRSELVVPIRSEGRPIGEVDVDGVTVGAFDPSDAQFLESVAGRLAAAVAAAPADAPPIG